MKILFFVSQFPCTSETFVLNQVTSMIDKGHDVRIYSYGIGEKNCSHKDIETYGLLQRTWYLERPVPSSHVKRLIEIVPNLMRMVGKYGFKALRLFNPKYGHIVHSRNLLQSYIALRFIHSNWIPDAIVSHFGDNGILITALRNAGIIPQTTKCFTYFHAHEICRMDVKKTANFYGAMFNEYDMLLPINHLWEKQLIDAGANPYKVQVLRMGVDLERFKYIDDNTIGDTVNILSVGRLCGQKGFEYAIRGVAEYAKSTRKKISYKIIGHGEQKERLKVLASELNATDYIHFLGAQPQQIVAEEMDNANVFLLPSVTDAAGFMEGIPVALMEAMARGLVCLSTYHSGIPELIENGVSGFLCNEKDSKGIACGLLKIERLSPAQFDAIRQKARNVVENGFDVIKETRKLQKMIEESMN